MSERTLQHEIGKKLPFESPAQEATLNIVRTASVLGVDFARFFRGRGLSDAQFNALRILRGHHPSGVPSQTIGEQLIAQVPDVTRLVDRLVEAGWAQRHRTSEDRRVVLVCITKAGLDLLSKLDKPILEIHDRQLAHMTKAELKELSRLLVKARHSEGPR